MYLVTVRAKESASLRLPCLSVMHGIVREPAWRPLTARPARAELETQARTPARPASDVRFARRLSWAALTAGSVEASGANLGKRPLRRRVCLTVPKVCNAKLIDQLGAVSCNRESVLLITPAEQAP
jgi:hypothetical protein